VVTAPARRELVRHLVGKGLSERRSLAMVRMSANAYRYAPRSDRNVELRARILETGHPLTGDQAQVLDLHTDQFVAAEAAPKAKQQQGPVALMAQFVRAGTATSRRRDRAR
jgi:hypothetical protein